MKRHILEKMMQEIDLGSCDLNLLVLFEAVMRERHVGRTATRLHLSPSAVSHGISRLRRMLHDPLFLKHPKGVVPTDRAHALAPEVAEILQRVRGVIATAEGFDPKVSKRRFTIGGLEPVFAVVLPPLFAMLIKDAPQIDLSLRSMLPQDSLANLDARRADLIVQGAIEDLPPRFMGARLYEEEFALAMRAGHPLIKRGDGAARPTLASYCAASHVLVSASGDPHGAVDLQLKKLDRARRVAATVPNFLFAIALVADSDLITAVPRRSAVYARRFGVVLVDPPAPLSPLMRSSINVITTRAAMADAGVAWLFRAIKESIGPSSPAGGPPRTRDARKAVRSRAASS
jgi:DNA-binding transcriptional LysR family regulator